ATRSAPGGCRRCPPTTASPSPKRTRTVLPRMRSPQPGSPGSSRNAPPRSPSSHQQPYTKPRPKPPPSKPPHTPTTCVNRTNPSTMSTSNSPTSTHATTRRDHPTDPRTVGGKPLRPARQQHPGQWQLARPPCLAARRSPPQRRPRHHPARRHLMDDTIPPNEARQRLAELTGKRV